MLLYLDIAYEKAKRRARLRSLRPTCRKPFWRRGETHPAEIHDRGVMFMGLMPIMWSTGAGADVMKRIAAPMIGGIFTSFSLELVVYPAIYEVWKWHFGLKRELALAPLPQGESS